MATPDGPHRPRHVASPAGSSTRSEAPDGSTRVGAPIDTNHPDRTPRSVIPAPVPSTPAGSPSDDNDTGPMSAVPPPSRAPMRPTGHSGPPQGMRPQPRPDGRPGAGSRSSGPPASGPPVRQQRTAPPLAPSIAPPPPPAPRAQRPPHGGQPAPGHRPHNPQPYGGPGSGYGQPWPPAPPHSGYPQGDPMDLIQRLVIENQWLREQLNNRNDNRSAAPARPAGSSRQDDAKNDGNAADNNAGDGEEKDDKDKERSFKPKAIIAKARATFTDAYLGLVATLFLTWLAALVFLPGLPTFIFGLLVLVGACFGLMATPIGLRSNSRPANESDPDNRSNDQP